ncbi:hypothetical protein F4780DRAFT_290878 [Xylariomycetidae sp. FL0641]|nr:hypothetical protein F4780DRAFT_290878 [Xylariomycetidae sp. FL0641]
MPADPRRRAPSRHEQNHDSQYPPVPDEEEDRSNTYAHRSRPSMAAGTVTLPSIQDAHGAYPPPEDRSWDSRTPGYGPSPNSAHAYPPPPPPQPAPSQQYAHAPYSPSSGHSAYPPPPGSNPQAYLPPVAPPGADPRAAYAADPRGAPYYAPPHAVPYGSPTAYEYGYRGDRGHPYGQEYGRPGPPPGAVMQQSAPRQRTSIACKYCRRRKIRCSGYQSSPGGKCINCVKMNQECLFQPVSASPSTAFVPVSALPNGPAPGMPLYGAYGQPLAGPSSYPPGSAGYQGGPPGYEQSLPSPTGSYNSSLADDRVEGSRRRQRPLEEDHAMRLPPPTNFPDDNARRRSPSSGSPGHLQPYQQVPHPVGYDNRPGYDSRTPPPRGSPSGTQNGGPPGASNGGNPVNSVMSLENIIGSVPRAGTHSSNDGKNIDNDMLGRLNGLKKK